MGGDPSTAIVMVPNEPNAPDDRRASCARPDAAVSSAEEIDGLRAWARRYVSLVVDADHHARTREGQVRGEA